MNAQPLTKKQTEDLLFSLDLLRMISATILFLAVAICANLAWGSWSSFIASVAAVAGIIGLLGLVRGQARRAIVIEIDAGVSFGASSVSGIIATAVLGFGIAALAHFLWWQDHMVRMLQIYTGLGAFLGIMTTGFLEDKIRQKLRYNKGEEVSRNHQEG